MFFKEAIKMTDKKGLYIHIPFCVRRCRYCDFLSFENKYSEAAGYFKRLQEEAKTYNRYNVDTIYFGGGTPSSVDSKLVCDFLQFIRSYFNVEPDAEITIEVNPDSVTEDKLKDYKKSGINRISMGAQSFCDEELKALGRLHNSDAIKEKYELIRHTGFDNVSLDLMFALPGQDGEKLDFSIDSILKLSPEHISCYGLKIEEGTPLYIDAEKGIITPVDDDYFADLYEHMCKKITDAGFVQYEISNFCKPGKHSRHNSKYWLCNEYIGLGAGASTYIDGVRSKNTSSFSDYKNITEEVLTIEDKMSEFVVFGLRMTDSGISIKEFRNRFGKDIYDVFGKQLEKYKDFITLDGDVLKLNAKAYYVSNSVLAEFML